MSIISTHQAAKSAALESCAANLEMMGMQIRGDTVANACRLRQMGMLHCLLTAVALLDTHAILSTLESSDNS